MFENLLLVGGIFLFIILKIKKKRESEPPKETVEDWLKVKKIDSDGLVQTEDDRFLYYLEVRPIPIYLKSDREGAIIWSAFRNVADMITHPIKLRSQSHPYQLEDYFQELKAEAVEQEDDGNMEYAIELETFFKQIVEQNKNQDHRYYLILEMSQRYAAELSAEISNPILNELALKKASMGVLDIETIRQELKNGRSIAEQYFAGCGLLTNQLDREGVLQYLYSNVNREMASVVSYETIKNRVGESWQSTASFSRKQYGRWLQNA